MRSLKTVDVLPRNPGKYRKSKQHLCNMKTNDMAVALKSRFAINAFGDDMNLHTDDVCFRFFKGLTLGEALTIIINDKCDFQKGRCALFCGMLPFILRFANRTSSFSWNGACQSLATQKVSSERKLLWKKPKK